MPAKKSTNSRKKSSPSAKKQTNKQLYQAQINRLEKAKLKAEKEGIYFTNNPIPELPKRVSEKALKSISSITPTKLKQKGYVLDLDTGELIKLKSTKTTKPTPFTLPKEDEPKKQQEVKSIPSSDSLPITNEEYNDFFESDETPSSNNNTDYGYNDNHDDYGYNDDYSDYDNYTDYDDYSYLPNEAEITLDNLRSAISNSPNKQTAEFIAHILEEELENNYSETMDRISSNSEELIAEATKFDSYQTGAGIVSSALSILSLILGEEIEGTLRKDIEILAYEDTGSYTLSKRKR